MHSSSSSLSSDKKLFATKLGQRQLRVGEEIRHILTAILLKGPFYQEVLNRNPLSVTEVKMSPDLKQARVFIMTLGGKELTEATECLNKISSAIRTAMAKKLKIRFMPNLTFQPDLSFATAARIEEILRSPKVLRDLDHAEL